MSKLRPTTRAFLSVVAADLPFMPLLAAMLSAVTGLEFLPTLGIFALLAVGVRHLPLWLASRHLLGPTEALHRRAATGRQLSEEALRAADSRLQRAPILLCTANGLLLAPALVLSVPLYHALVGPPELRALELPVVLLQFAATVAGTLAMTPPAVALAIRPDARRNHALSRDLGMDLERATHSVGGRLALTAVGLTLAPVLVMIAVSVRVEVQASYQHAVQEARALSAELTLHAPDEALAAVGVQSEGRAIPFVVAAGDVHVPEGATLPHWASSDALVQIANGRLEPPDRQVAVMARRLEDGRVAGALVSMASIKRDFVLLLASVLLLIGTFGPVAASTFSRTLNEPLGELARFARRIVEQGDLSEMGDVTAATNDEVGVVIEHFNELLDRMRSLAMATKEVGDGKLSVEIEGNGELPDAFRNMLERLRELVGEMHSTSTELASAATEISAASQEQDAAATSHSAGMAEISQTMDSLSDSATHVATAVKGVLENAERTLQNTDQMVARIDDLTGHANRIGDILDVIKEIANRTDLLALNGSLEASRAGEAGVGFSLVAAEMRRLAERVTGSVGDINQLVSDIRESGASTVVATEESKKLAQGTTEAARGITLVTQQQQSSTEQVGQNVRSVAEVVQQSATATAQTRASAESLKVQADRIATLVNRFQTTS